MYFTVNIQFLHIICNNFDKNDEKSSSFSILFFCLVLVLKETTDRNDIL